MTTQVFTAFVFLSARSSRRKADPSALHGPYMHWTRTVAGKTVTRTLTPDQAVRYQSWFDNARRIRELTAELEARSLQAFNDAEKRANNIPGYPSAEVRKAS